jgi:hypothetical protein
MERHGAAIQQSNMQLKKSLFDRDEPPEREGEWEEISHLIYNLSLQGEDGCI